MIGEILPEHYAQILKLNQEFVHWLSPMDEQNLIWVLERCRYARQISDPLLKTMDGVLFGYAHDVDYPDHKNIDWLSEKLDNYFYVDRIIISADAQGKGIARALYEDIETFARDSGYAHLACEVNTKPDNPGSHRFHLKMGFDVLGDKDYPKYDASLRYYAKAL